MSTEVKLDAILSQLKALGPILTTLEELKSSITDVKQDVSHLQFEVAGHGDRLLVLERQMQEQQDIADQHQQQLRSLTLRLLNFPEIIGEKDDNNAILRARVYDTILKPLLTAAKAAKDLPSVPQMATVIEACFRPLNTAVLNPTGPPHVIIKVSTRPIKIALLRNRKSMPKPLSTDIKRYSLVEDLTPASHKMLTALSKHKDGARGCHGRQVRLRPPVQRSWQSNFSPVSHAPHNVGFNCVLGDRRTCVLWSFSPLLLSP